MHKSHSAGSPMAKVQQFSFSRSRNTSQADSIPGAGQGTENVTVTITRWAPLWHSQSGGPAFPPSVCPPVRSFIQGTFVELLPAPTLSQALCSCGTELSAPQRLVRLRSAPQSAGGQQRARPCWVGVRKDLAGEALKVRVEPAWVRQGQSPVPLLHFFPDFFRV